MRIIGHHSCKKDGGEEYVLNEAPFISPKSKDGNYPFLGEGYYFWDNNITLANIWGKHHYNGNYYIIESELNLSSDIFLDLVGNRIHMILIMELHKKLSEKYNKGKKWTLGTFIEFLKDLNKEEEYKGIFPYLASRAVDYKRSSVKEFGFKFVEHKGNYTNLSPCLVICLYEKNDVILQTKILINQN